jgi:hypothetical protein
MPPAPSRNGREFFDLFSLYTPEAGLEGVLEKLDFSGVEPRQIYFALHGRAPERRELAVPSRNYCARNHLIRVFRSKEFRKNLLPQFLHAFPEKQRLLFIHIPKTAGSELANRFKEQYPYMSSQELLPGWGTEEQICNAIHSAVCRLAKSDRLFVCGHNTLEQYRLWRAIRFGDRIRYSSGNRCRPGEPP